MANKKFSQFTSRTAAQQTLANTFVVGYDPTLPSSTANIRMTADELKTLLGVGSLAIGEAVGGGTANRVLYIDNSGNLADSPNLTFSGTHLGLNNGSVAAPSLQFGGVATGLSRSTGTGIERLNFSLAGNGGFVLYRDTVATLNRFGVNLTTDPTAVVHARGNGTTTGELLRLADSAGTVRDLLLDNGQRVFDHATVTSSFNAYTFNVRYNFSTPGNTYNLFSYVSTATAVGGNTGAIHGYSGGVVQFINATNYTGGSAFMNLTTSSGAIIIQQSSTSANNYALLLASTQTAPVLRMQNNVANPTTNARLAQFDYNNGSLLAAPAGWQEIFFRFNTRPVVGNYLTEDIAGIGVRLSEYTISNSEATNELSEIAFSTMLAGTLSRRFFLRGNNLGLNTPDQFGSGAGVISIADRTTAPNANPTAASLLYSANGRLKTYYSGERDIVVSDGTTGGVTVAAGTVRVNINGTDYDLLRA